MMESSRPRSIGRPDLSVIGVLSALGIALAVAIIALSIAMASSLEDPGHPLFHAISAVMVLGLALLVAGGSHRTSLARRFSALGLLLLAASFLVEGVGGLGYDRHGRNDLAVIHDLGLGVTALAMLGATICLAIAVGGFVAARSTGRLVPIVAGVGIGLIGLFVVKTLVGL